jgi:uncharacterized membrane protein YccF (DUF307 family)
MRTILNVLWLIFGSGLLLALAYALAGILCFIFIVTIPFGVASFRLARYALWPFGYTITEKPSAGIGSTLANIVWLIIAGWWLALTHILTGIALCLTLIGIPFGIANFKLVPAALWPLGREITAMP